MLVLKNIRKTNNVIEANYYLEGTDKGYMKIRLSDGVILEHQKPNAVAYGSSHAQKELLRISKLSAVPNEKTVIWY